MTKRQERRAAERDRQKTEILDAAVDAFAARGYEGAAMSDIAETAGYSVGHIYNVVGKKEALFEAVMMRDGLAMLALLEGVVTAGKELSARECVDALIDASLEFFDAHRALYQIYLNETGGIRGNVSMRFPKQVAEVELRLNALVRRTFARARRERATADLSVDDMVICMSELVNGFIAAWALGGYRGKIKRKAPIIKHLLWKGIQA